MCHVGKPKLANGIRSVLHKKGIIIGSEKNTVVPMTRVATATAAAAVADRGRRSGESKVGTSPLSGGSVARYSASLLL